MDSTQINNGNQTATANSTVAEHDGKKGRPSHDARGRKHLLKPLVLILAALALEGCISPTAGFRRPLYRADRRLAGDLQ